MVACYLPPLSTPVPFTADGGFSSVLPVPFFWTHSLSSDFFIHSLVLDHNSNLTLVQIVSICICGWELILFHCDGPLLGQKRATGNGKLKFTS